jgi:hypothetical protein
VTGVLPSGLDEHTHDRGVRLNPTESTRKSYSKD